MRSRKPVSAAGRLVSGGGGPRSGESAASRMDCKATCRVGREPSTDTGRTAPGCGLALAMNERAAANWHAANAIRAKGFSFFSRNSLAQGSLGQAAWPCQLKLPQHQKSVKPSLPTQTNQSQPHSHALTRTTLHTDAVGFMAAGANPSDRIVTRENYRELASKDAQALRHACDTARWGPTTTKRGVTCQTAKVRGGNSRPKPVFVRAL